MKAKRWNFRTYLGGLGPGIVTGAADDDPSGISTYSVTGAAFGYGLLWTALISLPLMTAVQMMSAKLAMVTGRGLAGVIRRRYNRWVLWGCCALLIGANVINIAADLGGMAASLEMVTGLRHWVWLPSITAVIVGTLVVLKYQAIVRMFKWFALALFAYVIAAFLSRPDWAAVVRATFVPRMGWNKEYIQGLVGIFGTTISPYLFFWQASVEVEHERAAGRKTVEARKGIDGPELQERKQDVVTGMVFSNLIMFFIIVTTGATLYANGNRNIETAQQAAEALRPFAGDAAYWLFTIGLVGVGMLAIPVLAASAAFAVAESMRWRASLEDTPNESRGFYAVLIAALLLGLALNALKINAITALFWTAIINGLLAPPLIVVVTLLTGDPKVMGQDVASVRIRVLGWITAAIMTLGGVALVWTSFG